MNHGSKYLGIRSELEQNLKKTEFIEINAEIDSKASKVAKVIGAGATGGAVATVASPFSSN